jgi:hypothetical protein
MKLEHTNELSPVQAAWEIILHAKCQNQGLSTLISGSVKTFTDLLITTLPIPLILRMSMPRRQKYAAVALLGVGYLVTVAGALRTYFTWRTFYTTWDITWMQYPAFLTAAVENDVAVVC